MSGKENLTKEQVLHIAKLCNLTLTESEVEKLAKMLSDTLDYIGVLDELDTSGVNETFQVTGLTNVFQQKNDEVTTLSQEEALKNAKEVIKDMFATKGVFEE